MLVVAFFYLVVFVIIISPIVAIIIIIIYKISKKSSQDCQINVPLPAPKPREKWPFIKKSSLLTRTESRFYLILKEILQNDYLIFSKVKIGDDILYLPNYSFHREANRNRIKSRHVDFLICNNYTKPLLAIKLDDYTHNRSSRIERDNFVNEVFEDAGLPILHIPVSCNYDKEDLLKKIQEKLA